MDFQQIINVFLNEGILGVIILVLGFVYWKKDRELAKALGIKDEQIRKKDDQLNKIQREKDEIEKDFREKIQELQSLRIQDINDMNEANIKLVNKINETIDILFKLFNESKYNDKKE